MSFQKSGICFYIIIPVYKVEKYVAECLESILAQTYGNFRIIAVDDGTPDRSAEICEKYAARDNRITVLHQENKGQLAARQLGIQYAVKKAGENDYILFVDSDDSLEPNALQIAFDTIQKDGCDMVIWGYNHVTDGKITYSTDSINHFVGVVTDKAELYRHVFCEGFGGVCRRVTSAKLFHFEFDERFFQVRIGEDQLQFLPIYPKCKKVSFIADTVYLYRLNRESITMRPKPDTYRSGSLFLSTCWEFLEKENVWGNDDWKAFLAFCRWTVNCDLSVIARMECSWKEKTDLIKLYLSDPFFRKIIATAPAKPSYLLLAKYNLPRTIALVGTVFHALGKVKRAVLRK